jgi:hypothetical protein
MSDIARLFQILDDLIDRWCERRTLRPLQVLLTGYPPAPIHTDQWAALHTTIRNLKGLTPDTLVPEERAAVAEAHALIYRLLEASRAGADVAGGR